MPLTLEIKRQLSAHSERVKAVDFHPTEPWILVALYTGHLCIWNTQTSTMVKSVEASALPIRTAKFIARKQWVVCGSDDMNIRVYNYNTMERVHQFEAHSDYIRSLAVHPTQPYLLSSSDDLMIKLWDWEKGWRLNQVYQGHQHYVMQVEWNPKDTTSFASVSLDRTVKVWGLQSPQAHFTLEGHQSGVNCLSYYRGGDRPYLASGADDHTVRVWDYQTKACVATLSGHLHNVSAVTFHPQLPVIISGSEDGTVRFWHANTYKWESTLNYRMGRVWALAGVKGSNNVAIGYDQGTVMVSLGHEEPVASMDHNGKLVFADNSEIRLGDIRRTAGAGDERFEDGEPVELGAKDLGSCEVYPQTIQHSPNDRLVAVCGDGEFIIYTALKMKSTSFGRALEFAWAANGRNYAAREGSKLVQIYLNGKESRKFQPRFAADRIFGGPVLAVRSAEFVDFVDWEECRTIRRIEAVPQEIFWSESGEVCVLACETEFYVLRFNKALVDRHIAGNSPSLSSEHGIEGAFDLEAQIEECVRTGCFAGDCFIYTASHPKHGGNPRLQYFVGGGHQDEEGDEEADAEDPERTAQRAAKPPPAPINLAHLPRPMYLLGYLPKLNRVFLMDKDRRVVSYELLLSVLAYQTAVVRGDWELARKALRRIPEEHHNRIAQFLEARGLVKLALRVSRDPEHQFDMALKLGELRLAREILLAQRRQLRADQRAQKHLQLSAGDDLKQDGDAEQPAVGDNRGDDDDDDDDESLSTAGQEAQWKRLGDAALADTCGDLELAEEAYARAGDLGSLLLVHSCTADAAGLRKLGARAARAKNWNTGFLALLLSGQTQQCAQLLLETGRPAEAALFSRTYCPSMLPQAVEQWKAGLVAETKLKSAQAVADPQEYPDLFPDLEAAVRAEEWLGRSRKAFTAPVADQYRALGQRDLLAEALRDALEEIPVGQAPQVQTLVFEYEDEAQEDEAEAEEPEEYPEQDPAEQDVADALYAREDEQEQEQPFQQASEEEDAFAGHGRFGADQDDDMADFPTSGNAQPEETLPQSSFAAPAPARGFDLGGFEDDADEVASPRGAVVEDDGPDAGVFGSFPVSPKPHKASEAEAEAEAGFGFGLQRTSPNFSSPSTVHVAAPPPQPHQQPQSQQQQQSPAPVASMSAARRFEDDDDEQLGFPSAHSAGQADEEATFGFSPRSQAPAAPAPAHTPAPMPAASPKAQSPAQSPVRASADRIQASLARFDEDLLEDDVLAGVSPRAPASPLGKAAPASAAAAASPSKFASPSKKLTGNLEADLEELNSSIMALDDWDNF